MTDRTSQEGDSNEAAGPVRPRRVLVVEDDPIVSDHFSDIVRSCARLELAGVAKSLATARPLLSALPDLVLLDLGLPDGSGLALIPEIKQRPEAHVLVVTTFGDRETVVSSVAAGADGYLLKDLDAASILAGIESTLAGGAAVSPAAAVFLMEALRAPAPGPDGARNDAALLTTREIDLLKLFAKGASYKEAAKALNISPHTIGNHVKSIYRKLAVNSRGEAVYTALKSGRLSV